MLTEHTRDIIAFHDATCRVTFVSPAVLRILGYYPEEVVGRRTLEFVHPADVARAVAAIEQCRTMGGHADVTLRVCARDGRHVWIETLAQAIFNDDGSFVHVMSSSRDVTERKRADDEVRKQVATLRGVTEGITDAVFARRVDGSYDYVNRAAADLLGRGAGLFADVEAPGKADVVARLLGFDEPAVQGATSTVQLERQLVLNGSVRTYTVRITPRRNLEGALTGVVAVASDVTELVKLDVESRHRQKMEAVEQLAGGLAHDFNNLLTVIAGYGDLLEQGMPLDSPNRAFVEEICAATQKASTLTQRLLAFSRRQITRLGTLDVNAMIANLQPVLRSMLGTCNALDLSLADVLPPVVADQNQLEQALINLVLNAKEAMPNGGAVRIRTVFVPPLMTHRLGDELPSAEHGEVRLSVGDAGPGIEAGVVPRIFEPFFSTKKSGKGIGLGLSTVDAIVKRAGGTVRVDTALGKGSTFTISLPAIGARASTNGRSAARHRIAQGTADAQLVVDDEAR